MDSKQLRRFFSRSGGCCAEDTAISSLIDITLGIKIAQKPYIVSLGPKALIYESLDP